MKTKNQMVTGILVVAAITVTPMIAESADEQKASSAKVPSVKAPSVKKSTEVPDKKLPADNTVFELGQMVVTAASTQKLQSTDIITSVDVLNADKIQNQNVLTSYDLFHRMPGVQVTQFNQGTTTGKFSFRGFNGEGNINGVKLLIDGIPSNSNDGNMPFIDAIFPLDIESIEVLRGTNDPRYGLHAIAGNANIFTTQGGNYLKGRVSYGSFDTHDIQTGAGYESGGFSQNYTVSYRATNGYRDHASSEKNSFSGKWFYTPESEKIKVGLIARWSEAEAQESGYLTLEQAKANPTQSMAHNANDSGTRQVGQLSGHLDVNLTDDLFWSTKSYANTLDDQRWVRYSVVESQQERDTNEVQYGGITSLTYHPDISWLDDFSLESGFDVQQQDNKSWRYRNLNRARTSQTRNQDFNFNVYGGYLTAMVKPFKWLKLTPGFRADKVSGDYTNKLVNKSYEVNDYGTIWQPKMGAIITPIEGYSLYGNWGRTFQVAVGAGAYNTNPNPVDIAPSINDGWEVGVKVEPVDWAEGRVAYWKQTATNESSRVLNSAGNDSTLVGATDRQGVDIQLKVQPIKLVSVWTAFSLQEAIVATPKSNPALAGTQIFNTPNYLFSGGIDYQIMPKLKSSLWTTGQSSYYVDEANKKGKFGEYALLNLDIGYQVNKLVDLQFQVKNLTDTYWEYVWYNTTANQTAHAPGDGRAFYGAINVKYDL
ncbi:TonB-dependent receptor [Methylobacter sp. S3L5C]|uniref:TonB-dependent receptor n=1 Tax=Methylobacter sp. S3L5C TaxID=2839024 RepID=UPI001FAB65AF|nr:TonB-dependent receptor [Methylobacter sp. S3L5C]UOA08298.1 TonB-dependent receptor [Methylobacter sp. S3L5C]